MPEFRRNYIEGGTYFFTHVTYNRAPILCLPEIRRSLRNAFKKIRRNLPFRMEAIVVLPDHLHCLWTLPANDFDYSVRWRLIKTAVTKECKSVLESRLPSSECSFWQSRYWERTIRNEEDFRIHFDYIHYNPVKHGLVNAPTDWKFSTFRKQVESGFYDDSWGSGDEMLFPGGIGGE